MLTGITAEPFVAGGSLYTTSPLADGTTVLVQGEIEGKPIEPAAWTYKRADGGRSFYTSLGHKGTLKTQCSTGCYSMPCTGPRRRRSPRSCASRRQGPVYVLEPDLRSELLGGERHPGPEGVRRGRLVPLYGPRAGDLEGSRPESAVGLG